jgi:phage shock protein E
MLSRSLLPLLFAGCVCVSAAAAEHTTDSLDEVKKRLAAEKAVLLEEGRLKDAKLLPLSKVRKGVPDEELAKLMPQGKIVYAHCAAGVRCLEVADRLKKQGYEVRPLKAGYRDLLKAGFPKAEP